MKPFITDTHRTSVQGYLCFFFHQGWLATHSFNVCVCVCVSVESQWAIVLLFEFWPPSWPPVMIDSPFVQWRRLTQTPCCGCSFVLWMGFVESEKLFESRFLFRCHWMLALMEAHTSTCTSMCALETQTLTHLWSSHTPLEPSAPLPFPLSIPVKPYSSPVAFCPFSHPSGSSFVLL